MVTITVNVDDETDARFRETVKEKLGTGKGTLGTAIAEALNNWVNEKQEEEITKRQLYLLHKSRKLVKYVFNREDAYGRY
ncbi:hypothetical protein COV18_06030 [Candidatus Woesearchaeota archaeon CG10_big_fil_rev_8_21_14_0_10_37_12]|nr:MAG: hypothetical protein COV18_06030 [Candidatus Woesearchaeota archaeon CG10_big_fil_rev_8_21_14_0_10_37_12]